jgi:hypothetical protein
MNKFKFEVGKIYTSKTDDKGRIFIWVYDGRESRGFTHRALIQVDGSVSYTGNGGNHYWENNKPATEEEKQILQYGIDSNIMDYHIDNVPKSPNYEIY